MYRVAILVSAICLFFGLGSSFAMGAGLYPAENADVYLKSEFRCAALISLAGAANDGEPTYTSGRLARITKVLELALFDSGRQVGFYQRGESPHFLAVVEVPTAFLLPSVLRVRNYMAEYQNLEKRLYQNGNYVDQPRKVVGYLKNGQSVEFSSEEETAPELMDFSTVVIRNSKARMLLQSYQDRVLRVVQSLEEHSVLLPQMYSGVRGQTDSDWSIQLTNTPSLVVLLVDGFTTDIQGMIRARASGGFSKPVNREDVLAVFSPK